MHDKKLLYEAIDDCELLPRSSRAILRILIDLEDHKEAIIALSILKLSQMAKISRNSTYYAIKALEDKGFIHKWTENRRSTFFSLVHESGRLDHLVENYLKRKKYFT